MRCAVRIGTSGAHTVVDRLEVSIAEQPGHFAEGACTVGDRFAVSIAEPPGHLAEAGARDQHGL